MHDIHPSTLRRPSLFQRSFIALGAGFTLTVISLGMALSLGMADSADAQSSRGTQNRGARTSHQARPQAAPFLQAGSLSGIRPNGYGKFVSGGVRHARPQAAPFLQPAGLAGIRPNGTLGGTTQQPVVVRPIAPSPRVIYVPVGVSLDHYFPRTQRDPVVIVQQAPPPQPVVVMVPPTTPATPPPAAEPSRTQPAPAPKPAVPKKPGLLTISILPAEAEIFLNDRRLRDLDNDPRSLDAGVHVLEISHPDFPDERLVFGMGSAGNVEIEIDLREAKSGRRTRLRETSS